MARSWSFVGLTDGAESFLEENVKKIPSNPCPHCEEYLNETRVIIKTETEDSFYGDGPILHTYMLNDGRECKEIIQEEPWSSGPVTFLCLEIDGKRMFEWTNDQIDERL
jgi:hypothetical protein